MEKVIKTIPALYRVTAIASSNVSCENFVSNIFAKGGKGYNLINEKLYPAPHTAQPIWEGNYYVEGNKCDIEKILDQIMDCGKTRKSHGYMDYNITQVS